MRRQGRLGDGIDIRSGHPADTLRQGQSAQGNLGAIAAREPADERAEHEPRLGGERNISGDADDDADRRAQHRSKGDRGSHAHVRESMAGVLAAATSSGDGAGQRIPEAGDGARDSATARSASSKLRRVLMVTAAVTPEPAAAGTSARGSAQLPAA
jgi:hypothetical protein